MIGRGVYILYIYKSVLFFGTNLYLPKYSLSEVCYNTDRLLIEFNGLVVQLSSSTSLRGHRKS